MSRIRILVVDDSRTARVRIIAALSRDPECEVVGEAADGHKAIEQCEKLRPSVVTLDMMLPGATGVQVTEHVMAHCPTPILIVSSSFNRGEILRTLDALAAGAVDVLDKPRGDEPLLVWDRRLIEAVKVASRVKVIRHIRGRRQSSGKRPAVAPLPAPKTAPLGSSAEPLRHELIAMGASTGGPSAILAILGGRPFPSTLPVLLTIHIGQPFELSLAEWLRQVLAVPVSQAADRDPLPRPGRAQVIVAPAGWHLVVQRGRLRLSDAPSRNSCRPSIDVLFDSVAEEKGARAIGCLLTGMGRDGASGLLAMRRKGALTIAQDEASSVVFGMPREAIQIGAAEHVLGLQQIRVFLSTTTGEAQP